jgi:high-affinity nickel-transport protein
MRHGVDPDHLAAIDGLTRLRTSRTNGIYFALGHSLVVILLAVGIGHLVAERFAFLGPRTLIAIGTVNLWRLVRPANAAQQSKPARPVIGQPFLLGMLLAAGFETASQLSALIIAGQNNPWILGLAFSAGMVLVDGIDGSLAAGTQRLAAIGQTNALRASKLLGVMVVIFSFGLGGAELIGIELDSFIFPLGLFLFAAVIGIRIWARGAVSANRDFVPPREPHSGAGDDGGRNVAQIF